MRHGKRRTKLSVMPTHRKAMMRNMVKSLIKYQKIETTLRRAKEVRRLLDRLVTIGKVGTVASRRQAYAILGERDLVSMLFNDVAPLFVNRNGGYTRIIPLGFRRGDGATMAIIELTEKKIIEKLPRKKDEKPVHDAAKPERHEEAPAPQDKKAKEEHKARAPKAKVEDKKIGDKKKFLKNLRGFFQRKSDM